MGGFERDLRKTDNRASAGIASAMATAALPQPSEAGRSMASIAAGSYNGESGVALGISGVSEGGRWIYKFSGSTNSRGEAGVAVGAASSGDISAAGPHARPGIAETSTGE